MTQTSISRRRSAPANGATRPSPHPRRHLPPSAFLIHGVLMVFVVIALGPIFMIVMNSLKTQQGIFGGPFDLPNAETFSFDGYFRVFQLGDFGNLYFNSATVTIVTTVLTVGLATIAAFAIVEYKIRLAPVLSAFFIIGIMLPVRLGTVSLLQMMSSWNLVNTTLALILVYTGMSLPLGVALMVTYFRSIPQELKDAARIDGAGEFQTLGVVTPMVRPGLGAVAALTMLPIWNDLWFPLILAPGRSTQTVTLGVQQFMGQYDSDWPALLAALTLGAIPLILLFLVFSKQFIKGLSEGYGK
ncbi:raffinose/stachyose/melibiose transport system permease protein [Cryobacterium mesophilum]|uniref:Carbohydrate ABC transporter permease n=1 Tax=Terrimesophilobacter mesophilus TaxID=433647 RepID=A0A4R8VD09_9MICO|nr:carbohydrate ABC transporter permease [Terrimesophilobacter mesophilus]MBB5633258.1 raffinose/stachyose/melibiose transport system permease protein [Terrimesophilobacter mesophilus]TFB80002.1 carbohydrate ABC transporter permease [Terrimesophilobacter mesophilus]